VNTGLKKGYRVGVLDLDIGQSHVGPAGSLGFGVPAKRIRDLSHISAAIMHPIGRLSPAGVTERIVVGVKQMLSKISHDVDFLVIDTCGYIHTEEAVKLKSDLIEVVGPTSLVFLEQQKELDPLMGVISEDRIWRFPVDSRAKEKSLAQREKVRERSCNQSHRDFMIEH
jgi:polynucleotide 5'-hydroxyl-kinase GRC3/NOL9